MTQPRNRGRFASPHTAEFVAEVRRLWDAGMPAAEIGRRLGVTKNTIIGIAYRHSFGLRPVPANLQQRRAA